MITVKVSGIAEARRVLSPANFNLAMKNAMTGGVELLVPALRDAYPPTPAPGSLHVKFKTAKQRRYFFWALRMGQIDVPYKRGISPGSQVLGKSWRAKVTTLVGGVWQGFVGTRVSYARYVMDAEKQADIHKGRWPTVQQIVKQQAKPIQAIFDGVFRKALGR